MDDVLDVADHYIFTPYCYPTRWASDDPVRQSISLYIIIMVMCYFIYFLLSSINYHLIFVKQLANHLRIKDGHNKIKSQILMSCISIPLIVLSSIPLFLLEVRGHSLLYDDNSTFGVIESVKHTTQFIIVTDLCVYWIHRSLHHAAVYKYIHKHHHKWTNPTPFAGHAVHPLDAFLQMLPYHAYVFMLPLHKWIFLSTLVFINLWTVCVHDGDFPVHRIFQYFASSAVEHTDHHLYFSYNYGHVFSLWDKAFGTHKANENVTCTAVKCAKYK